MSLDYLVVETSQTSFDKRTLERIHGLELLEESKKQTLYELIDMYIRDFKNKKSTLFTACFFIERAIVTYNRAIGYSVLLRTRASSGL